MSKEVTVTGTSPLFFLFLLFLGLKLTGYITWSWWWVTAPLWGGLALVGGVLLVIALIALIITLVGK